MQSKYIIKKVDLLKLPIHAMQPIIDSSDIATAVE
jgi:hypothetical protein